MVMLNVFHFMWSTDSIVKLQLSWIVSHQSQENSVISRNYLRGGWCWVCISHSQVTSGLHTICDESNSFFDCLHDCSSVLFQVRIRSSMYRRTARDELHSCLQTPKPERHHSLLWPSTTQRPSVPTSKHPINLPNSACVDLNCRPLDLTYVFFVCIFERFLLFP